MRDKPMKMISQKLKTTFAVVGFALSIAGTTISSAYAVDIKTVVSDKGIKALLVEDYAVPLIAVSFSFKGGSTQDAVGKEGTASLLTNLLDEGAGDLDSQAFQVALDDNGMKFSFNVSQDSFSGSIQTLKSESARSFELLTLMLNNPRFDADPIERMKASRMNGLRAAETNPQAIASKTLRNALYPNHPYGRPSGGTLETMPAITKQDLETYRSSVFARDNVVIGVVGAISPDELKAMLDQVFGPMAEKANLKPVPETQVKTGETIAVDFNTPQTIITMAMPGIKREDEEFYAAYLVNYVLGGGSFSSRLYEEVREKRGLAYGVYSYLGTKDHSGVVGAGTATSTRNTEKAVEVILAEIEKMAKDGPSAEELEKAKKYIKGSYAISNLDTSGKIASVLSAIQSAGLGIDYIDKRASYLDAVTIEDAKAVAQKLLSSKPTIVTVGKTAK
jgi:zinc protease